MSAPVPVMPELLRALPLPDPGEDGDKNARGRVLVIAGSAEVPGAALLAGTAALRAGAGKLQIATVRSAAAQLAMAVPEARVIGLPETPGGGIAPEAAERLLESAGRCDAVLLGPGMMDKEAVAALTAALVRGLDSTTLVLDAEALTGLDPLRDALRRRSGRTILTPHAGEMAALCGIDRQAVEADTLGTAAGVAERLEAVVALKGACTCIVMPDGRSWTYDGGNVGLATSGSGDTLAGVVAGLAARGTDPLRATLWGVHLHGEAGNRLVKSRGPLGFLARELLAEIPALMVELAGQAPGASGSSKATPR